MSHSKILFLVLILAFSITSAARAGEHDAGKYRYLSPLSTNIKPEDLQNADEPEDRGDLEAASDREAIYMKHEEQDEMRKEDWDPEVFARIISEAEKLGSQLRNSKEKAREIEREIVKQRNERERELKKLLAEIDREHRKHIVEIERQQRRIMREMEREYKRKMKD